MFIKHSHNINLANYISCGMLFSALFPFVVRLLMVLSPYDFILMAQKNFGSWLHSKSVGRALNDCSRGYTSATGGKRLTSLETDFSIRACIGFKHQGIMKQIFVASFLNNLCNTKDFFFFLTKKTGFLLYFGSVIN